MRLLHAGDADECDRTAAREPEPVGGRDQEGAAGQHLPLHGLLEHHRGREVGGDVTEMTETTIAPEKVKAPQKGWGGQSVKRKEDKRLLQGEGGAVAASLAGEEARARPAPFFQISSVPGGNIKDFALAVGKVRSVGEPVVA